LNVIERFAAQAVHVLDRFHIVANVNKAIDLVRAGEAKELAKQGYEPVLKHSRWCFLKRPANLTHGQLLKLADVLRYDLRTVRAYLLKAALDALWTYRSEYWAGWYLDKWCARAMRSRLEPMKKIARSLRTHRLLALARKRGKLNKPTDGRRCLSSVADDPA
jgi:transposase